MPLEFSTSELLWRPFDSAPDTPAADAGQLKIVTDFVNGFFHSHGHPGQAQDAHAARWYASQHQAFRVMLAQLVGELADQARLDDLDLVVLAHWTPDVEVGCSVTNAVIHQTGCDDAFGMAISDHGLGSAFFSLQVIEDYLDGLGLGRPARKALLMIADQDAILYDSPTLARFNPVASACVVMLHSRPGEPAGPEPAGIRFKHYRTVPLPTAPLDTLLDTLAMYTPEEDRLPLLILTTPGFVATLREHQALAAHRIECWDEALLSCAPWARLQQLAPTHQRILMILPQGNTLACAGFVAGA